MAGSLLVCQEIKVTPDELRKITGGSSISPADIFGNTSTEEAKQLSEALKASEQRAREAFEAEKKAKRLSTTIAVGSFLIAATGLFLTFRSRSK